MDSARGQPWASSHLHDVYSFRVEHLVEQLPRLYPESVGELQESRDLRVPFAGLDSADLTGLDTASLGELFLRQLAFLAGRP